LQTTIAAKGAATKKFAGNFIMRSSVHSATAPLVGLLGAD